MHCVEPRLDDITVKKKGICRVLLHPRLQEAQVTFSEKEQKSLHKLTSENSKSFTSQTISVKSQCLRTPVSCLILAKKGEYELQKRTILRIS